MSKAILVIDDLPDDINIEDVGITYIIQQWNGQLVKAQVESVPLKPLPRKRLVLLGDEDKTNVGYNFCINEILGED